MLYPLIFQPLFKERVWGGRRLAELFGKQLPDGKVIGESWEITDRPEGVSVIANGPLAGRDLRWLMAHHGAELLGRPVAPAERFPWLIKLIDAREDLSLQVHPSARSTAEFGGEAKSELWFVAAAAPGAKVYAGLKRGVTRAEFERKTRAGSVAECFHTRHVAGGDAMFLPSGRVHALGAGNLVFEVQQNSDTTYRVFDWNRLGLDGKPRELHLEPAFASIDFFDCEPDLIRTKFHEGAAGVSRRVVVRHELFQVQQVRVASGTKLDLAVAPGLNIFGALQGTFELAGNGESAAVGPGGFVMIPASLSGVRLRSTGPAEFLSVTNRGPGE